MLGKKVDIFERDGFETDEGRVIAVKGDTYTIKCGAKIYKIPKPSISISLTTRGNSLEQYLIENKTKTHYQEGNEYPACSDRLGLYAKTTDDVCEVTCKNCVKTRQYRKALKIYEKENA